jgi:hypothetical protein
MKPCKEYHMPCEVVLLRFDFFKMAVDIPTKYDEV